MHSKNTRVSAAALQKLSFPELAAFLADLPNRDMSEIQRLDAEQKCKKEMILRGQPGDSVPFDHDERYRNWLAGKGYWTNNDLRLAELRAWTGDYA